jgi:predicted DCC family thiol-disulfide oxidoreductase YuxK
MITQLYVIYDDHCGFCSQCAVWLTNQPKHVAIRMVPHTQAFELGLFPGLRKLPAAELVVIDDRGGVYYGDNAWLMTLWALRQWRPWSTRFATPTLKPMARNLFEMVSTSRHSISWLLGLRGDAQIAEAVRRVAPPDELRRCGEGECSLDHAHA